MASSEEFIAETVERIGHDHSITPEGKPQGWLYRFQGRVTAAMGEVLKAKMAGALNKQEYGVVVIKIMELGKEVQALMKEFPGDDAAIDEDIQTMLLEKLQAAVPHEQHA